MNGTLDTVMLSRLQFAVTIMFHMLWPVVTIGLSLFLVALEGLWIQTGDRDYYVHARFWSRLFVLFTALGVVTGIPMEFQFGTNWSVFSIAGGDFFGNVLGFEGAMAFMLEATFVGIMLFGWDRVPKKVHLFATCMVALGASLSAFWILVANSWMQVPAGGYFDNGRFVVTSYREAMFNLDMPWSVTHMWVACLEITAFMVGCRERLVYLQAKARRVLSDVFQTGPPCGPGHGAAPGFHRRRPGPLHRRDPACQAGRHGIALEDKSARPGRSLPDCCLAGCGGPGESLGGVESPAC